ncbi:hypothetical protein BGZ59_011725 [Podila verticillata]|nr:hypothetical protein BGZ59_011725 [Podila verticillata]KFH64860.1 hypothetical protein MVEG_09589 [Podila verticillata NRRL 6337]
MTVVDIPLVKEKKRKSMSSPNSPEPEYNSSPHFGPTQENMQPQPSDDAQWIHWHNSDNEDENNGTERHLALASARAGKKVVSKSSSLSSPSSSPSSSSQCLPNEILLQVFEYLLSDQGTLFSCTLVSLNWHRCATSYLYRYPRFASTLHWALFIQTLCRSKITVRPKARRRRSIIQNLSRSRQFSPHQPSQLAPAQIEVFGGQPKWKNDRLLTDLGRYVHGIDLSKRPIHVHESTSSCCASSDVKCKHRTGSSQPIVQNTGAVRRISRLVRSPSNNSSTPQARRQTIDLTTPYDDDDDFDYGDEEPSDYLPQANTTPSQRVSESNLHGTRRSILYRGAGSGRRVPWFATATSSPPSSSSSTLFSSVPSQGSNDESSTSTATDITITFKRQITITVSSLIELTRHCPNLEVLSIVSAQLALDTLNVETGDYQSTTQPGPHTGLTFVTVTTKDAIKAIGENCPKLQQLTLAGCDWLTTDEVMSLVTRCLQLHSLDLSRCGKLDGRLSKHLLVHNEMNPREFFDSGATCIDDPRIRSLGALAYEGVAKRFSSISTIVPPISMSDLDVPLSDLVGMSWSTPKGSKSTSVDEYPFEHTGKVRVRDGAMLDLVHSIINDHPSRTTDTNLSQASNSSSSSQGSQLPTMSASTSSSDQEQVQAQAQTQMTQQWQMQYNQQQLRQLQHHYRFHREQARPENNGLSFFELLTATFSDSSQLADEGASVGASSSPSHHTRTQIGDIAESGDWGSTLLVVGSNNSDEENEQDRPQEDLFEL